MKKEERDRLREEWRPVVGYEGYYEVSDQGRVRSLGRRVNAPQGWRMIEGRVLKLSKAVNGYVRFAACVDGASSHRLVHRAVLEAFVGPCPAGMQSCHNNGQRDDNRVENLRWDTLANNTADIERHGRRQRGERHHSARLTDEIVRDIRMRRQRGESLPKIGRRFGIASGHVSVITTGRVWKHVLVPLSPKEGKE